MKFSDRRILDLLLHSNGNPASNMTRQLKNYGDGDMAIGIQNVFNTGFKYGELYVAVILIVGIGTHYIVRKIIDCHITKMIASVPSPETMKETNDSTTNDSIMLNTAITNDDKVDG